VKFLMSLLVLIPYTVYAQDTLDTPIQTPNLNYDPGIGSIIFKIILSLVVIIGLIYLTVFFLRKISNRSMPSSQGMIKVVGKSYLTPKQSLFIVKLGSSYSVLGVGDSSVNYIKDLSPEEAESFESSPKDIKGFQNIFKSVLGK
jgi:flagellar biosynthetic protein FliO